MRGCRVIAKQIEKHGLYEPGIQFGVGGMTTELTALTLAPAGYA